MGKLEFSQLLIENFNVYLIILTILIFIYFLIFRKLYISFIDPLIISQIFSLFASSVVYFLSALNLIDFKYTFQFTITQLLFWIGLFTFSPKKLIEYSHTLTNVPIDRIHTISLKRKHFYLFYFSSLFFIIIQLLIYAKFGIPLFLESRLSLFSESGGGGILGRIVKVLSVIVLIYGLTIKKFAKKISIYTNMYVNLVLGFYIITLILSGSKSTFLNFLSVYFLWVLFFVPQNLKNINKYQYTLIGFVFISALFIISIQNNTQSSFVLFIERLIGSGDIFYQGYYDDKINAIQGNSFNILFADILGSYRIIPWSNLPKPIGMQLYNMTYNVDLNMGANARHNYLGLVCFGYFGSFFFSFLLGMIISFVRHKLFFQIKNVI
jgi:hypothetical protein